MLQALQYSISDIQDEVSALVARGLVNRQQPMYTLCQHFKYREWQEVERVLESHDYLLRDQVSDLMPCERWAND